MHKEMEKAMPATDGRNARTAIIVTGGDSVSTTPKCLEFLFEHTPHDIGIFVVLAPVPDFVRHAVAEAEKRRPIEVIEMDRWHAQNVQRNLGVNAAGPRDNFIFLDNDSVVGPNWTENLMDSVVSSGADAVEAVFIYGENLDFGESGKRVIHMAGGECIFAPDDAGRPSMEEHHFHIGRNFNDLQVECGEEPYETWLLEFHCVLLTASAMAVIGRFDEALEGTMEHVDTSVTLIRAGKKIAVAPKVEIEIVRPVEMLCDVENYVNNWGDGPSLRSNRHFCRKYGLAEDGAYFKRQRSWDRHHLEGIGVVRRDVPEVPPLAGLCDHRFARTWTQFASQLLQLRWAEDELAMTRNCYEVTVRLFDGLYRADGKPFISHAIGTASILAAHGAPPFLVDAGLAHAAYLGGRMLVADRVEIAAADRRALAQRLGVVRERIVRTYCDTDWPALAPPGTPEEIERYPLDRAQVLLIQVANDIEEHLDHGLAMCAKVQIGLPGILAHATAVLPRIGHGAMLRDLEAASALTKSAIDGIPDAVRMPFSLDTYVRSSDISDSIALPDRYWIEVAEFLRRAGKTEDPILAPDEFRYLCPNIRPGANLSNGAEALDHFVIHKGRLADIDAEFLTLLSRLVPVFANEVFIVFSHSGNHLDQSREVHLGVFQERIKQAVS